MLGRPINIQVPLPKVWLATASGHLVHQLRGRAQLKLWRHTMIRKVHQYVASDLNNQHFLWGTEFNHWPGFSVTVLTLLLMFARHV